MVYFCPIVLKISPIVYRPNSTLSSGELKVLKQRFNNVGSLINIIGLFAKMCHFYLCVYIRCPYLFLQGFKIITLIYLDLELNWIQEVKAATVCKFRCFHTHH